MITAHADLPPALAEADVLDWLEELGLAPEQMLVCGMAMGYADPEAVENTLVTQREPVSGFVRFLD